MSSIEEKLKAFRHVLEDSKNVVFFGGAGVSTASGIPDFRSPHGLYSEGKNEGKPWASYPPEELLSHNFFMDHTDWFYEYYRDNVLHPEAKPNRCHQALAHWEQKGKLKAVVTQNIDGLHQAAGSRNVIELHGTTLSNHCLDCHKHYDLDYVLGQEGIPHCSRCGGTLKPDVTLYGEALPPGAMEKAVRHIAKADLLIVGGTSLAVYPAAGLIHYFNGDNIVLINLGQTSLDSLASLHIPYDIDQVFADVYDVYDA